MRCDGGANPQEGRSQQGALALTRMPPIRCSPRNSRPFLNQRMLGLGLPEAGQRNFTVFPAGTA